VTRLSIGEVRLDELDALVALSRETYRAHYGALWSPEGLVRHLARRFDPDAVRADLLSPAVQYLVARDGQALAGYAKIIPGRPLPGQDETGTQLERLYLDAARTGEGLGTALLDAARRYAELRGASRCMWLDVLKTSRNARRFYERHGFVTVGELPFATDLGEIGFWTMRRAADVETRFTLADIGAEAVILTAHGS
jgi:ribosomal protein S18 acetylase RimI-like enzyme